LPCAAGGFEAGDIGRFHNQLAFLTDCGGKLLCSGVIGKVPVTG
jgi:hypothetical protein